jgi:hypothetical protein
VLEIASYESGSNSDTSPGPIFGTQHSAFIWVFGLPGQYLLGLSYFCHFPLPNYPSKFAMSLSAEQIEAYLDRIALPQDTRASLREGPNGKHALKAITTLQHRHLATIPFENLDLQYSSHHSLPQDTEVVFDHVVKRRRGGVCDQIHQLFAKLLISFGFTVYCTGSRINAAAGILADPKMDRSKPSYGPW